MLKDGKPLHRYATALEWCKEKGYICSCAKWDGRVTKLPKELFENTNDFTRRSVIASYRG